MSSLTKMISIFSILVVAACSFSPVYDTRNNGVAGALAGITQIEVEASSQKNARYAQQFKAHLEDAITRNISPTGTQYKLVAAIGRSRGSQLVQPDSEVTRYELRGNASWKLIDLATDEEVASGRSRVIGSYDAESSDFATYAAEEDTAKRVIKELAVDVRLKLANALSR